MSDNTRPGNIIWGRRGGLELLLMSVLAPVLTSVRLYRGETIREATGTDAAGTVDDLFGQPRKFCRRPSRLRTSTPLAALIPVNTPFFQKIRDSGSYNSSDWASDRYRESSPADLGGERTGTYALLAASGYSGVAAQQKRRGPDAPRGAAW